MEQKTYKKSLVVSLQTNEMYSECFDLLKNNLFNSLKKNEESLCFFRGKLTHSEKVVNAMELTFEWSTVSKQPERSKREDSWKNQSMTNSQLKKFIKDTDTLKRCGTLNTMET